MQSSEPKYRSTYVPGRKTTVRGDSFITNARPVRFRLEKPRAIWYKDGSYSKWPFLFLFALLFLLTLAALTQAAPPRSRGARAIALGGAYTAVSGDPYSLYFNPAGLYDVDQSQIALDYGRAYSIDEAALSDFNAIYSMPYRFKDMRTPIAIGVFGEAPAPGAHVVDITGGFGTDAPLDRWTKGFIKKAARIGGSVTLRQQGGETKSDRVGKSSISLGLSGGLMIPINKKHQFGLAIRNLFAGDANPQGASINVGATRRHKDYLDMFAELEYARGGIWRVKPGLEWLVARGVLRPRLGWGYRDSGKIDHVATGLGFYLSPMQIDISYLIPVKTVNDNAGQLRASLVYRFGLPQFSEIYYDRALEAASTLDQNVLRLTTKEAELKASLAEVEQKRRLANEELKNMRGRIEELKDQDLLGERDAVIRQLKDRVRTLEGSLTSQRSENSALRQKKAEVKTHTVVPGDTLQSIAREYYGDPNQWKKIFNANPDKIERGLPRAGSKLVIP